ncbi:hypothetical protein ACFLTZ_01360 [Chloroflexota bacterium]
MLKVTIDTNVIINEKKRKLLVQIKQLAEQDLIDIAITTRVIADKDQDKNEGRISEHLKEFDQYPKVGTILRWDFSRWDSGDFWVGEEHIELSQQIEKVIFGKISSNDKRSHNKLADIDHLIGHLHAKRNVFVTFDKNILKKSKELHERIGITVTSPEELIKRFPLK